LDFNKLIDISLLLKMNFIEIKDFDLKIINIRFNDNKFSINEHCDFLIEDLELLLINDIKSSRYGFLFEEKD